MEESKDLAGAALVGSEEPDTEGKGIMLMPQAK